MYLLMTLEVLGLMENTRASCACKLFVAFANSVGKCMGDSPCQLNVGKQEARDIDSNYLAPALVSNVRSSYARMALSGPGVSLSVSQSWTLGRTLWQSRRVSEIPCLACMAYTLSRPPLSVTYSESSCCTDIAARSWLNFRPPSMPERRRLSR
jgi:hypothetical protein